jgi:4'-phosphopantetheinyl transferase
VLAASQKILPRSRIGKRWADDEIDVVSARLDVTLDAVRASAALLSKEERQRAARFAFDRDRNRFVVARGRLRELLAARLGVPPGSVELVYGARGKPALSPRFADAELYFNVSHSGDVAAYAFSHRREIGVDVERVRVIRDTDDIAARFFSRRENEAYLALDQRDKLVGFFNCWTRKEAFIKALGEGVHHPLDSFDVTLAPREPAKILRVGLAAGDDCDWVLHSFVSEPGFVGAVVIQKS